MSTNLETDRVAELHAAKAIVDRVKAAGRSLTPAERADLEAHFARETELARQIHETKSSAKAADDAAMFQQLGHALAADRPGSQGYRPSLQGKNVATPRVWAAKAAQGIASMAPDGVKAVVSGSLVVPSVLVGAPGSAGFAQARTFLDLIQAQPIAENNYGYLQQTVRTNNAAPVADLATKPTSVFTVDEIEDRARVIAHLSEPIPQRYFQDHTEVVRLLESEMAYGVVKAMETQAINGIGTGENWRGLLNVTGIASVPWSTDMITTLRKAWTTLMLLDEVPTAFVLNPADLETLALTREGATTGQFLSLVPAFWGAESDPPAFVPCNAVPAGTALLGDWSQARLYVREGARLDMDTSGTNFTTNAVTLRAEQRANVAYLRPRAFAKIDLTAA